MTGGLLQLVATGAQDLYLVGNPQITMFKITYRRHTNFALESIQHSLDGQASFGAMASCSIPRMGDLVHRVYLEVTLPPLNAGFKWVDYVGLRLIKSVCIEIGGQKIDTHYADWLYIFNELTLPIGKRYGYDMMVGAYLPVGAPSTTLTIPLEFWFCRNVGNALPIVAMQYHDVKLKFEFETLDNLLLFGDAKAVRQQLSARLWTDFIFLDTDERRRFAQLSHEMLIEQVQCSGDVIVSQIGNVDLYFNHPCKELIWTLTPNDTEAWLNSSTSTADYTTKIISLHGGSTPFYNMVTAQLNLPAGWTTLPYDASMDTIGEGDNSYGTIPDLGFDFYINGNNARYTTEVYTDFFIKFDGRGYATYSNELHIPDQDTPNAPAIHLGSIDHYTQNIAYKPITSSQGYKGMIIRLQGQYYFGHDNLSNVAKIHLVELTLWENGQVDISIPSTTPDMYLYATHWGYSDGNKWMRRFKNPMPKGVTLTFNLYELIASAKQPIMFPKPEQAPSVVALIYPSDHPEVAQNKEYLQDLYQSYFNGNSNGNIITTTDTTLNNLQRPDVFFMYTNTIESSGWNVLRQWVSAGTFLYIQGLAPVMKANEPSPNPTIFQNIFEFNKPQHGAMILNILNWSEDLPNTYCLINSNPILKDVALQYCQDAYYVDPTKLSDDVTVLALTNAGYNAPSTASPTLFYKQFGQGIVMIDCLLLRKQGTLDPSGGCYRGSVFNDIYTYVSGISPSQNTQLYVQQGSSQNLIDIAQLMLNGNERFAARQGDYFSLVQPFQHHTNVPQTNICVYSFALEPETHQPSGTLNFSRVDTAVLKLKTKLKQYEQGTLRIYAVNYNVLRVMSGMAGLAYSN